LTATPGGRTPSLISFFGRPSRRGWSYLEALLLGGLLAAGILVAKSQFEYLRRRAQESAVKGKLGTLRGALLIYYGDNGGMYPDSLEALTDGGKYLTEIPREDVPPAPQSQSPGHAGAQAAEQLYADVPADAAGFQNEGRKLWGYVALPGARHRGHVFVNCAHKDSRDADWTRW